MRISCPSLGRQSNLCSDKSSYPIFSFGAKGTNLGGIIAHRIDFDRSCISDLQTCSMWIVFPLRSVLQLIINCCAFGLDALYWPAQNYYWYELYVCWWSVQDQVSSSPLGRRCVYNCYKMWFGVIRYTFSLIYTAQHGWTNCRVDLCGHYPDNSWQVIHSRWFIALGKPLAKVTVLNVLDLVSVHVFVCSACPSACPSVQRWQCHWQFMSQFQLVRGEGKLPPSPNSHPARTSMLLDPPNYWHTLD